MEEKERYRFFETAIQDTEYQNTDVPQSLMDKTLCCIRLNEQDARIKELEDMVVDKQNKLYSKLDRIKELQEENQQLKKQLERFINFEEKISKLKYGQTVWCVFPDNEFRKGFIFDEEFVGFNESGIICKINDLDFFNFDEVFETKEEAIEKLEQLRRNKNANNKI